MRRPPPARAMRQRWQQVIFCKSKSSHKSFPCKSKSSHKSFPCKSKSRHKSFGQTSSQVTSHLVQTQVKSQVSLSKYKSSRTLFCPAVIRNQGQASHQSTVVGLSGGFTPCRHLRPSSGREHTIVTYSVR